MSLNYCDEMLIVFQLSVEELGNFRFSNWRAMECGVVWVN